MNWAKVLETYSLEEILEYNDLEETAVLEALTVMGVKLEFPPLPVDCNDPPDK